MLYLRECGKELTNEQAMDLGTKLIRLIKVVYGPNLPKEWKPKKVDPERQKK